MNADRREGKRSPVLIAGGGVAALELMLGLRRLAGEAVDIDLLSPTRDFAYAPLAVAEPFGVEHVRRFGLAEIADEQRACTRVGALAAVDPGRRLAITADGASVDYDLLVIATGARPRESLPGALTFVHEADRQAFRSLLDELTEGASRRVVFAVPGGVVWALPLYELALMTASYLGARQIGAARLSLVTPEEAPLGLFGADASRAVHELLSERGIALHTGTYPAAIGDGCLVVTPGDPLPADRVVTLPRLEGPFLPGLPHDAAGFIPTDAHGRVQGVDDVYAAGDVTNFPIKQGGIATQQADAVAEAIAARAGADVAPQPFRPVLRGLLLTGSTPSYMSAEITGGRGETSTVDMEPLWWPPSKIAGRYLSHYWARVAAAEPASSGIRIEVDDLEPFLH